jgi:protease-4
MDQVAAVPGKEPKMAIRVHWIIAVVAVFFVAGVVLLGVGLWLTNQAPEVEPETVLMVTISGDIQEEVQSVARTQFFFEEEPTLWDHISAIDVAAADENVSSLLLKVHSSGLGWAKIEELRSAILRFRESGKTVFCWVESGEDSDYYLATAADEIYAPSGAYLGVDGLASYATFFKGTLDWAGITADLEHVGEFKDAAEPYTRKKMSEPSREALNALLDDRFSSYVEAISQSRDWDVETTRASIDGGPYSTEEALAAGLIDSLFFEEEVEDHMLWGHGDEIVSIDEYFEVAERQNKGSQSIALVFASGTIVSGESGFDLWWGHTLGQRTLSEALLEARTDEDVKAIVLRIDSPGGETDASRSLWNSVKRTAAVKPVVASFSDVAASGGYYIAMGADLVVSQPGTLTGSIGVLGGKFNLSGLYEKLGIDVEVVGRGKNAQFFSPVRDFTPAEREKYLAQLWEDYQLFIDVVVENRGGDEEIIEPYARGRVWTGGQAYVNGLVDTLGGFETAISEARRLAGIPDEVRVRYVVYPRVERTFLQRLVQDLFVESGVRSTGRVPWARLPAARALASVAHLTGNSRLAWMPYEVIIR